jgi:hypothetical protein
VGERPKGLGSAPSIQPRQHQGGAFPLYPRPTKELLCNSFDSPRSFPPFVGFVKLIKIEWNHANEGQPQHDVIKDFPTGVGLFLAVIQGSFEKVQDNRQIRYLMREEPNCSRSLALDVASSGGRESRLYLWFCIPEI